MRSHRPPGFHPPIRLGEYMFHRTHEAWDHGGGLIHWKCEDKKLNVQLPTTTSLISLCLSDPLPTVIFSVWVHDLVLEAANESSERQ